MENGKVSKIFSQMRVKDGDESHGTIRKTSPEIPNPSHLYKFRNVYKYISLLVFFEWRWQTPGPTIGLNPLTGISNLFFGCWPPELTRNLKHSTKRIAPRKRSTKYFNIPTCPPWFHPSWFFFHCSETCLGKKQPKRGRSFQLITSELQVSNL